MNYITPVVGAKEAAVEIDPELAENQLIFPDEETLSNAQGLPHADRRRGAEVQAEFQSVLLGA